MVQSRRELTVLGIDPGTTRVGYALISGTTHHMKLIVSGVVGNRTLGKIDRLSVIYKDVSRLISQYRPDFLATESLFFSKNVKTALSVAEARGVILLTANLANLTVYEYAPNQVKIAITGSGNAAKADMLRMIQKLLAVTVDHRWDDETDAVAIAITGLVTAGNHFKGR